MPANASVTGSERCEHCPIKHFGICETLPDDVAKGFADATRVTRVAAGSSILHQGEPSDKVGLLVKGTVKVINFTQDGAEQVLHLLTPGSVVGYPDAEYNTLAWEAATDVTLCWLPVVSLQALMISYPTLTHVYLKAIVAQLQSQRTEAVSLRGRNAVERVANWIAIEYGKQVASESNLLLVSLSRKDLSSLLDMSPETLCRSLRKIEDRFAMTMLASNRFEISDLKKLKEIAMRHGK